MLNKVSVCELRGHAPRLPTEVASSEMLICSRYENLKERKGTDPYTTIFFLNRGQSNVNVSYSPPSPQIWPPYFLESWKIKKKGY